MEALGLYLAKASAIIALFLGVYLIFLKRETLFWWNRLFLISGLGAAILLPLFPFKRWVTISVSQIEVPIQAILTPPDIQVSQVNVLGQFLVGIYLMGVVIGFLLLAHQLWKVISLIKSYHGKHEGRLCHITDSNITSPFSFFIYIFYNPDAHDPTELRMILEHERAHARQFHTVDILLGRLLGIVLWFNPFMRWYQKLIIQNLEYLADAEAVQETASLRDYQYALLKISGNTPSLSLTHNFYNSFIKNRILMLHQHPSNPLKKMKHLLILPVLAFFIMAFNTETVYRYNYPDSAGQSARLSTLDFVINKNTGEAELRALKEKLAADAIDFSYTTVRNETGEIISLSLHLTGKNSNGKSFSGSYNIGDGDPIEPVYVSFNDTTNQVTFGGAPITEEVFHLKESGNTSFVWISDDSTSTGDGAPKEFIFRSDSDTSDSTANTFVFYGNPESDAENEIRVVRKGKSKNNEAKETFWIAVLDKASLQENSNQSFFKSIHYDSLIQIQGQKNSDSNVKILNNSGTQTVIVAGSADKDNDTHGVYKIAIEGISLDANEPNTQTFVIKSDPAAQETVVRKSKSTTFVISDAKNTAPLFYVDGKKVSEKEAKSLDPDTIEKMEVLKGDKALEAYGKKAEGGVVLITLKKSKSKSAIQVVYVDKNATPLYYIDGKKSSEKEVKALDPDTIDKMEVLKGEKAIETYGIKAEVGVILITLKK
jgi:hypothetical protein